MNMIERNAKLKAFFNDECLAILEKKGQDYNPNGVAFDEIRAEASAMGISGVTYMCVLMSKHWGAVKRYAATGRVESEAVRERLKDLANYSAMMAVFIEEEAKNQKQVVEELESWLGLKVKVERPNFPNFEGKIIGVNGQEVIVEYESFNCQIEQITLPRVYCTVLK